VQRQLIISSISLIWFVKLAGKLTIQGNEVFQSFKSILSIWSIWGY